MVESTTTDKQNAAQLTQQEKEKALQDFMTSASVEFDRNNRYHGIEDVGSSVDFNVGGVEYACIKRKTHGKDNNTLWIDNNPPDLYNCE